MCVSLRWLLAPLAVLAFAPQALAADVPQGLRAWLRAIDTVPTPDVLRRASKRCEHDLDAVARDPSEGIYLRHRAISFLSMLPSAEAESRLTAWLDKAPGATDAALRETAVLAWATGPGRRDVAKALPKLLPLLDDPVAGVRAATARAAVLVSRPRDARAHLVARLAKEQDAKVRAALERAITTATNARNH